MPKREKFREAVCAGDTRAVQAWLDADPAAAWEEDETGWPAVLWAAHHQQHGILRLLVGRGADLDARLTNGFTVLQAAVRDGNRPAAQCLLSHSASLDLFSALGLGAEEHVKALVEASPKTVGERDGRGNTLLHWAVEANRVDTAQWLLEHDADVNAANLLGETPLHRLLDWDPESLRGAMAELLVAQGARVDAVTAAALGLPDRLREALAAEPRALRLAPQGRSLLHWAARGDSGRALADLVERGLELDQVDRQGDTALHTAAHFGHEDAALALVELGASRTARDARGHTPAEVAAHRGFSALAALLRP